MPNENNNASPQECDNFLLERERTRNDWAATANPLDVSAVLQSLVIFINKAQYMNQSSEKNSHKYEDTFFNSEF